MGKNKFDKIIILRLKFRIKYGNLRINKEI